MLCLLEDFPEPQETAAVQDAVARRLIGFDAVKHFLLTGIERRPVHLDLARYPHLPQPFVATTPGRRLRHPGPPIAPPCWPWLRRPASCPKHHLNLPTFLREYEKPARQCAAEDLDQVQFLARMVEMEMIDRERRIRQARFPVVKQLESVDFKAIPSLNKMLVLDLARGDGIDRRENAILLGPSGVGRRMSRSPRAGRLPEGPLGAFSPRPPIWSTR